MEILSKSQDDQMLNGCYNYGNNNIFTESNYKYIFNLKMNKIKEEIKDYVIDKYLNKIIEQNKEINDIKSQLEDLTKKYINIIKLMINNKSCMNIMDNNNQSFINRYIYKKDKSSSIKKIQQRKNNSCNKNNNDKLISIEKNTIDHHKKSNESKFYDNNINLEKKKRKRNTYDSNKENISYNLNINSSASNINYLKELNKKDQKKINDIHNILKASRIPKRNLKVKQLQLNSAKNNEINRSINFNENENKSTLYSRIDLNDSKKMKTNKHRNKIKQKINKNCLYFNTEENQDKTYMHKKKFSLNINSRLKDRLFRELKGNYKNFMTLNSIEEYNKTDINENENENQSASNLIYNYNKNKKEHKRFKTFFYQFKKINSSFNESFKDNTSDNNLFEDRIKSKFVCNPIFGSFLNRNEDENN
mgnify:CR=1 FL=1